MTTPDHDESKPRRRWPTYLTVVLILVVFVIYPLSIGPAAVVEYRWQNKTFTAVGGAIYFPLFWISETSNNDDKLTAYIMWWMHYTGTNTNPNP